MIAVPAVSIVIPTYNHAPMLKEALRSVLAQTCSDWEAVVINNFSDDNTVEVVDSFCDPRIRLVNFRNHGIIAASRNEGIRLARGEWVAFLDSDDVWYPEKLERCLAALESGTDLVCHGEVWRKNGIPFREIVYGPVDRSGYRALLFEGNCLSTSAVVVRREALIAVDGFSEEPSLVTAEDYELWLKLAGNNGRFLFIGDLLGEYRLHAGNESKNVLRNMQAVLAVVELHATRLSPGNQSSGSALRYRRARLFAGASLALFKEGKMAEALRYAMKSIGQAPLFPLLALLRRRT